MAHVKHCLIHALAMAIVNPRAFDTRSAACCHPQRNSWSKSRWCKPSSGRSPPRQCLRDEASHERPTVLLRWILEFFAAAPSDPRSSIRGQTLHPPNYFLPSFLSILPNIPEISFHGTCRIRLGELLRRWKRTSCQHWLKGTQKTCDNLTAASKLRKRQAYPQEGSRGRRSRYSIMECC